MSTKAQTEAVLEMGQRAEQNTSSTPSNNVDQDSDDNENKKLLNRDEFRSYLKKFAIESVHKEIEAYVDEKYKKTYPSPFLQRLFPQDWQKIGTDHSNKNFKIRRGRAVLLISVPCIFLILCSFYQIRMSSVIGICLLLMFTLYFSIVIYYVFIGKDQLYRIYSVSHKSSNWANLNTGYVQLLYKKESVQSISELSAINGGVLKTMLNTIGAYSWAGLLCHFVGQLYYNDIFRWDAADICEIIGVTGLLLVSLFELDPFNKNMEIMHYVGAGLGGASVAGYCIQQWSIGEKFWFALILASIAVIGGTSWHLAKIATEMAQVKCKAEYKPEYQDMITLAEESGKEPKVNVLQCLVPGCIKGKSVNTYSKMNVGFETLFLYSGALCLCLWLIEYDEFCDLGCAGPKPQ